METRGRSRSRSCTRTTLSRSKSRYESPNETGKITRCYSQEKPGAFRSRSRSLNKSTISSRSKSRSKTICAAPNESDNNQKTGENTTRCNLEEGSGASRSRSRSLKRSTFSGRSMSKSKDRCDGPNECAGAFRSRSRSLNRSTISSRSRSRNRIDEAGCVRGRKEGTNGNDRESEETKSGAARSGSRGRVVDRRRSSMLLMPCLRGGNNQATVVGSDSNEDGSRCRSIGSNRWASSNLHQG